VAGARPRIGGAAVGAVQTPAVAPAARVVPPPVVPEPAGTDAGAASGAAVEPTPAPKVEPPPVAPQSSAPATGATATATDAVASPIAATAAAAPPIAAAGNAPPLVLTWLGPFRVKVGEEFNVMLRMNSPADLHTLPLEIHFDSQVLSFLDAQPAEFAQKNGASVQVTSVDAASGLLKLELRTSEARTLRGQGDLLLLRFSSLVPWKQAQLTIAKQDVKDDSGAIAASIRSTPLTLRVTGS